MTLLIISNMTFREWLFDVMESNQWTQQELGDLIGVTQTAVGRWLKGTNGPDARVLKKLADVSHTNAVWLFQLVGYLPPSEEGQPVPVNDMARTEWNALLDGLSPEQQREAIKMVRSALNLSGKKSNHS